MANFYTDNPALKHHLTHPLMEKIVALKERNYTDAEKYDYAPLDFEDAMDSYDKVLEIVGEICGDIIAGNAEDVDHQGPRVENGRRNQRKPRGMPQGRPDGHGDGTPLRRSELPDYPLYHGGRHSKPCRHRF